jgi:hypothetical protein
MNPEREPRRMSASGRVCPKADSIRVELAQPRLLLQRVQFGSPASRTTLEHVPVCRRRSSVPGYLFHEESE